MRISVSIKAVAACAIAGLLGASQTLAAPIGNPNAGNGWNTTSAVSIVRHSGERDTGSGGAGREIINMINGTGISGVDGEYHAHGAPHGQMAMFYNGNALPSGASAPNPGTQQSSGSHWVEFQFDQPYVLNDIAIWNYNEVNWFQMGWQSLMIQVSQTGSTNPADWTTVYNDTLPASSGGGVTATLPALVHNLGGISAQYVTLINTGLGGDATWLAGDDGSHAGLSEVRFNPGYVPEPALLSMLGLGMLALFRRRV